MSDAQRSTCGQRSRGEGSDGQLLGGERRHTRRETKGSSIESELGQTTYPCSCDGRQDKVGVGVGVGVLSASVVSCQNREGVGAATTRGGVGVNVASSRCWSLLS